MKKTLFGIAALSLIAVSNAQLIDDFSTGPLDLQLDPPAVSLSGNRTGAMIGGSAAHSIAFISNPDGNRARMRVVPRSLVMSVSDEDLVATRSTITYGAGSDLNVDFTGQDRFLIGMRNADLPVNGTIKLETNVGGVYQSKSVGFVIPSTPTPTTYAVSFGGLVGSAGFQVNNVDRISFEFNTQASGDFSLTELSAVPEPGTMAAIGLGVAAMIRRRRNAKKA
jgi:hypothetical protein